jgi:hypothetical protein
MEFTREDGKYSRLGAYPSKEACEAAIPNELQKQKGYNGHCIEFKAGHREGSKWIEGHFIGSQDPALAGE